MVGNVRVTEVGASTTPTTSMLDFGAMPFPVLEGSRIGVIPPGRMPPAGRTMRASTRIASPRNGERPGYNNLSLTIKRVLGTTRAKPVRGVAEQLHVRPEGGRQGAGDRPFGSSFLMPNHPKSHIVMICTGTGSGADARDDRMAAPPAPVGQVRGRQADAVLRRAHEGELPYFGPLQNLPKDFIDINFAFSRTPAQPGATCRTRCASAPPTWAAAGRPQRILLRLRPEGDGRRRGGDTARHRAAPGSTGTRSARR